MLGALEPRQVDELARVGEDDEYGGEETGHPEEQVAELQRQVLCSTQFNAGGDFTYSISTSRLLLYKAKTVEKSHQRWRS